MNGTQALKLVQGTLSRVMGQGGFDRVLSNIKITEAGEGKISAELIVTQAEANRSGTMHGGMMATIIDQFTTLAMSTSGRTPEEKVGAGVSVNISINYMSGINVGETLLINANTLRRGRTLAFLTCDLLNKSKNNRLVARGEHVKFMGIDAQ